MLSGCTDPSFPRFTWLEEFQEGQGRKGFREEKQKEEEDEEEAAVLAKGLCLAAPSPGSSARLRKIILLPPTCHLTHKLQYRGA